MVSAVDRAGDVVARLTSGLGTRFGPTWPCRVDLSFDQWQKLALARGFMRDQPLLLSLDEPTVAPNTQTEHALSSGTPQQRAAKATAAVSRSSSPSVSRRSAWPISSSCSIGSDSMQIGAHDKLMVESGPYRGAVDAEHRTVPLGVPGQEGSRTTADQAQRTTSVGELDRRTTLWCPDRRFHRNRCISFRMHSAACLP